MTRARKKGAQLMHGGRAKGGGGQVGMVAKRAAGFKTHTGLCADGRTERGRKEEGERKDERREGRATDPFLRAWTETDPVLLEKVPKSTPGSLSVSALILKGHHTPALIAPLSWN